MRKEDQLQIAVSTYLKLQYPGVVFTFDASGFRLSRGMAARSKKMRSEDKIPDMLIMEPRGEHHALLLELKATNIYKKDGTLLKNEHVEAQARTLEKLRKKGYFAVFVQSFDEAQQVIDTYMNGTDN